MNVAVLDGTGLFCFLLTETYSDGELQKNVLKLVLKQI